MQITDKSGHEINFGTHAKPILISTGQTLLTYYVSPVRVSNILQAGAYRSVISFQIAYE
ncbi:fimbrial protein [Providencia sneebia]|uniref:MrfX protein n=1 Tax=Providencia sneebia DSM 19967 TaxID=1141660 RepID=K8WNP0_9GAMM|nr:hypothetical protein [Providencia sneebia]EKT61586.1 MrfX protein [Providencia sneebia DSM 19967]